MVLESQKIESRCSIPLETTNIDQNVTPLLNFCNLVFCGKVPDFIRPYFFGARLLALCKKDGGIRPIAVGNTIRRLVAKAACHLVKDRVTDHLAPKQTGFNVKNGAEAAIHATRCFIEKNVDK